MSSAQLVVSIVRRGWGDAVLQASVKAGAKGGTVVFGRGSGVNEQERLFGIPIEPEKEIVLTVTYPEQTDAILDAIVRAADLNAPGSGIAFVMPIEKVVGVAHLLKDRRG